MVNLLAIDGGKPVRDRFLVFGAPCLGEAEIQEVVETLRSGWIGTGPKVQRFEREFAAYVGAPQAIAVNSCTAGLHLALLASGIGDGDEVIVPAMTFAATANVVVHCGATPVFVDVQPETLTLDPVQVAQAMTPNTKAIVPVHFGGLAADLDALQQVASGMLLIEDAAHAVGTQYRGQRIGSHGHLTCFSFYANKNITTAEGGMITLPENEELAKRLMVLRLHGLDRDAWKRYQTQALVHNEVTEAGFKYNLTDLQASLGIHQLARVEDFLTRREALAESFDRAFEGLAGVKRQYRPLNCPGERHGLHLYVLILDPDQFSASRDQIVAALRAENIGAGIHYTALHLEPFYQRLLHMPLGSLPVSEFVSAQILSLPLTPFMSDRDAQDVVDAVYKVLEAYRK